MAPFVTSHFLNVLLMMSVFLMSASCQEQRRSPSKYLVPDGYVGWVRIDFRVENAPPTPFVDGSHIFKFPPSGYIQTSSDIEYGWANDEEYYYSGNTQRAIKSTGWGGGGMIWGGTVGSKQGPNGEKLSPHLYFFVGTEEDFRTYGNEKDKNHQPIVGPIKTARKEGDL